MSKTVCCQECFVN